MGSAAHAGVFFLLPLLAALAMFAAFTHLGRTQAKSAGALAQLRNLEQRATFLRWQADQLANERAAVRAQFDERAEEFAAAYARLTLDPLRGDDGAEDEAAAVKAARNRLGEEWGHLSALLTDARSHPSSGASATEFAARVRVRTVRLEGAMHDFALAAADFEREALEADIVRLSLLTALLLLAFGGVSFVLFTRTSQVRERERQVRQLAFAAQHAGSGVIVADGDGIVLWANAACDQLLGWLPGTTVGHQASVVMAGAAHGDAGDAIAESIRSGRLTRSELVLQRRDGRTFWGEVEVAPVAHAAAGLGDFIVTFQDVSRRREAAEALAGSEARFRSALESMAEGLIIQGEDGVFHMCNAAAARILGLTEDQLNGRTTMDPRWRCIRDDGTDFPGDEHPIAIAQRTGRAVSGVVMGVRRPDDTLVWVSVEANAIWRPGCETPVGAVATFLDVTARRQADREIRKLMQAVEQSPAACIITNANREIEYVNQCFEEATGWRKEELVGRNPRLLASGQTPRDVYRGMWEALSKGERWTGEVVNHRRDGRSYRARMTAFPLRDPAGVVTHYVSFSEDVTEEHRREQELARAREEALAAARAKSEFLQNMSHELRTPMNGILGMADLLGQSELSGAQRADLETLRTSADQLLTVISQLFDFTRLDSDGGAEAQVPFRLRGCLQPVATRLATMAESRSLSCRFDVAPNVPDWLLGDPGGLRQVLLHLTDNALKFTDRGEVVVLVTADPDVRDSQVRVRFEVRDTGIGIPPERQDAIFEAFEQADSSSTRKYGGLGLGLTLARLIVSRLGGRLLVSSETGKGSTFAFTLPFAVAGAPVQGESAPATEAAVRPVILLVDGGGAARTHAADQLGAFGAEVHVVPGAEGAIALLGETAGTAAAPQAIVLDARGGGLEPFAAARRLRDALGDRLPPVALVAVAGQRGDAERCRELGVHAYLTPPLGGNDLCESVQRLLQRGQRPVRDGELLTRHVLREARRQVHVLLVEDNAVNRKVATRLLERSGFTVGIAEDGKAGADRYREGGWDVVLMDMQMPVMDGIEATRCIRAWESEQRLPRTPIVAVTAHTMDDDREAAREAGMDGFVSKPIQADELLRVIHECVGDSPTDAEAEAAPPELREVLDWDEALERMDGDEMVLNEILRLFLQDSENMMERLEEARSSGDAKLIERAAHGLKGASATISARAVAPLARRIESLARDGELVKALDLMQELRVEMQRLRRGLEALPQAGRKAA